MNPIRVRRAPGILLIALMVAGCGGGAPGTPSGPAGATTAGTTAPQSPAVATVEPTADPTPEPLVLGGTWVRPKAGAALTSYTTTLSARPTATGDGVTTFTEVVFSATWPGGTAVACKAAVPGEDGAWSCKANLLALGVPPGTVTFSFDVHGAGVAPARSPDGARKAAYEVPPPRPASTSWKEVGRDKDYMPILRVRWSAPAGYADEFLVYETFECPRPATERNDGKPCFVPGTPVDVSQLELLAKAPGDARSVKVRPQAECWPSSILLRARNAYGKSGFAIVDSAPVIWIDPDSNDVIC